MKNLLKKTVSLVTWTTLSLLAMIGVCYLLNGKAGAEAAENLLKGRLTLVQSRMPISNLTTAYLPFRVPKGGHVDLTAEISAGGEANVYVVSAAQFENYRAGRQWSVQYGFHAPDVTGTIHLEGRLETGEYYLLAQNENLFSDIRVEAAVVEDFKK